MHNFVLFLFLCGFKLTTAHTLENFKFHGGIPRTDFLTNQTIEFLRPYSPLLRKWLWETSGQDYPFPISERAEYLGCDLCMEGLPLLRQLLSTISDEVIISVITTACIALELAPRDDICRPMISSYAISVSYILRNKEDMPDGDFCGIINPGCAPVTEKLINWRIRLNSEKPLVNPRPELPSDVVTGIKILQFTDIHFDMDYAVGMNAVCELPICCRKEDGPPNNPWDAAGTFGSYGCGLPETALTAMFNNALQNHGEDTKFIFLTGDYVHSGVWLYSREENEPHIQRVVSLLNTTFKDRNVEIYPVVGNHEPSPVNMYPPEAVWNDFSLGWLYDAVVEPFKAFLPAAQVALFKKYGYYTVTTQYDPKLRIVVLNTNICYINNFWLPYDPVDTFGQLQWFADTLALAEKLQQKVIILGHIHPGSDSCFPTWSNWFYKIVNRYEALIKGQFYGHNHQQYYKIALDNVEGRPIGLSFVGGSGLPSGMNPAYNVYYADGGRGPNSTWEFLNHQTYILNLAKTNASSEDEPILEQLFDAKSYYGLDSMVPEEMEEFVNRMICDDELFLKYQKIVVKGEDSPKFKPCVEDDKNCKASTLSGFFGFNSADKTDRDLFFAKVLNFDCTQTEGNNNGQAVGSSLFGILIGIVVNALLLFN